MISRVKGVGKGECDRGGDAEGKIKCRGHGPLKIFVSLAKRSSSSLGTRSSEPRPGQFRIQIQYPNDTTSINNMPAETRVWRGRML